MKWQQLNTPQAIDEFMMLYGHFHDSCIKEIRILPRSTYKIRFFTGYSKFHLAIGSEYGCRL